MTVRRLSLLVLLLATLRCASTAPKHVPLADGPAPSSRCQGGQNCVLSTDCCVSPCNVFTPPGCLSQQPTTGPFCNGPNSINCSIGLPKATRPFPGSCPQTPTPCGLGQRQPGVLQFAVIGDWGDNVCPNSPTCAKRVADMLKGFNDQWPLDFILTTGDNFYPASIQTSVNSNMALYDWIKPQPSGPDDPLRFLPSVGNHDLWDGTCGTPYFNYFQYLMPYTNPNMTKPLQPRYYAYSVPGGLVDVFSINANDWELDGIAPSCAQATWIGNKMLDSKATWKIVIFHQPFCISRPGGMESHMGWPFADLHASIVINGHVHLYERIIDPKTNLTYVTNGIGGVEGQDPPTVDITGKQCYPLLPGSKGSYSGAVGALIGIATPESLSFCMVVLDSASPTGYSCIDSFSISPGTVATPTHTALASRR